MKFGIFYELSVPRPWGPESERTVYMNALEQVRLADELGFDQVWAVEHHFLEEYSHCSAPELFLTACAMQTKRIRVGHGIVVCVPAVQPPDPHRRAGRRARHPLGRPARSRHRALRDVDRARRASRPTPTTPRRRGTSSSAASRRCGRRSASATRARPSRCRRARSCRSRTRSRTRRCGSPSRARAPSSTRPTAASAASG